jgi:hypothetical protein
MKNISHYFWIIVLCSACTLSNETNSDSTSSSLIDDHEQFTVFRIPKDSMEFRVGNVPPAEADFYLNSNFFSDQPIGLVVIDKKRQAKRTQGGGYFYVCNGKAHLRALECPKMTDYASQSILWGINDGKINEDLLTLAHGKEPTYRTLMGENEHGDILVIASNRTGLVTIEEIITFGLQQGLVEGVLFDGGSSVEYKFSDGDNEVTFKAMNGWMKKLKKKQEPPVFIYGNFIEN